MVYLLILRFNINQSQLSVRYYDLFGFQRTLVGLIPYCLSASFDTLVGSMWTSPLEHEAQFPHLTLFFALYVHISVHIGGLKWTRTTDLALIRRAL